MTAAAERTVVLAAAIAVVLLATGAYIGPEWLRLYLPSLALPVLTQGLATGLRWRAADPVSKEML